MRHVEAWTYQPTFLQAAVLGRRSSRFYVTNPWPARLAVAPH